MSSSRHSARGRAALLELSQTRSADPRHAGGVVSSEHVAQSRQLQRLREFARSVGVSEETAISIYEGQLVRLRQDAHLERYISVRAEKHARDALRKMKPPAAKPA
jgi:hypothetical protein